MFHALLHGFKHSIDFSGRDSRALFWNFIVCTHLLLILLCLPALIVFLRFVQDMMQDEGILSTIVLLAEGESPEYVAETLVDSCIDFSRSYFSDIWHGYTAAYISSLLAGVWGLLILIPTFSAISRRLRDAGQSPWWVLPPVLSLLPLPFVAGIIQMLCLVPLVMCFLPSAPRQAEPPAPEQTAA